MSAVDDIDMAQAQLVIERIAVVAQRFAAQAGVGAMETAGNIVSYLAEHPRDVEPLLKFGVFELPVGWHERGSLTWHGQDGKIHSPAEARRSRIINNLKRPGKAPPHDR